MNGEGGADCLSLSSCDLLMSAPNTVAECCQCMQGCPWLLVLPSLTHRCLSHPTHSKHLVSFFYQLGTPLKFDRMLCAVQNYDSRQELWNTAEQQQQQQPPLQPQQKQQQQKQQQQVRRSSTQPNLSDSAEQQSRRSSTQPNLADSTEQQSRGSSRQSLSGNQQVPASSRGPPSPIKQRKSGTISTAVQQKQVKVPGTPPLNATQQGAKLKKSMSVGGKKA